MEDGRRAFLLNLYLARFPQVVATDADGDRVTYSISGDFFSIDRINGRVTLVKPVDRERMRSVEVILTITGENSSSKLPLQVRTQSYIPYHHR